MGRPSPSSDPEFLAPDGEHLTTISHQGRFWDIYVELESDFAPGAPCRARLAYSPADRAADEFTLRTIPVIVEANRDEALRRAHRLEVHQLVAFLRSLLP
jgi:hypothetical protein